MTNTIYLITGASHGIGRGLAKTFLARSNTTVIAAVREPVGASSQSLQSLPKGESSRLIVVKIDSKSPTDPAAAVETLQREHGIDHLDVVIANAGISEDFSPVHRVSIPVLREHVEVNGYGPIYLYQAVHPLLKKSKKPTFVGVGSPLGSIGGMEQRPWPCAAYGPSKAMLHWIMRKIHFENEDFVSFVADPGFPQTDMGNAGAQAVGLEKAFQTVEESVGGIVKTIDEGTRESVGAQLRVWDGSQFPCLLRTVMPTIIDALCPRLFEKPDSYLDEMAIFTRDEFRTLLEEPLSRKVGLKRLIGSKLVSGMPL